MSVLADCAKCLYRTQHFSDIYAPILVLFMIQIMIAFNKNSHHSPDRHVQ